MKISLYRLAAVILLFVLGAAPSQAQTIETTYPASICDTSNVRDDNSVNPHISKGSIAILGISDGVSNPDNTTSVVYCPIPRRAPDRTGRVRIDLYAKRYAGSGDVLELRRFFLKSGVVPSTTSRKRSAAGKEWRNASYCFCGRKGWA